VLASHLIAVESLKPTLYVVFHGNMHIIIEFSSHFYTPSFIWTSFFFNISSTKYFGLVWPSSGFTCIHDVVALVV
jgi:hypothetical protein